MIHVGIDWAEAHHGVCIVDDDGAVCEQFRIDNTLQGVARLHEKLAGYVDDPEQVVVGIETDRGLLVHALKAAAYRIFAVNPLRARARAAQIVPVLVSVDRYRDRHSVSGAKSDAGDAKVLADLVRTDRHNHRPVAGDSQLLQAIKVLARTHQDLVWTRTWHRNQLRNALMESSEEPPAGARRRYPAALDAFDDLAHSDAIAVLSAAPTPDQGQALSVDDIVGLLEAGGRQRNLEARAQQIHAALQGDRLAAPQLIDDAFGARVGSLVALIATVNDQIDQIKADLQERFEQHPDAELTGSIPGLGTILGARMLAEFGDDPNRYDDAKSRANYAGTSPITIQSGNRRVAVARYRRNKRLADACDQWAFCSLSASEGARAYYDAHNPHSEQTAKHARRKLANKLVKILHGVLRHRQPYDEHIAWRNWLDDTALKAAA